MQISIQEPFDFKDAVTSHGWWMLAPSYWDAEKESFYRPLVLETNKIVVVKISMVAMNLCVDVNIDLTELEQEEVRNQVSWMFRLNEVFQPFYTLCETYQELAFLQEHKRGRLLRSPSLFEDMIKVLFTTNTRWQQTIQMSELLTIQLGDRTSGFGRTFYTFPSPERIKDAGESFLQKYVRVGYRSRYILDAAEKILNQPERYLNTSSADVFKEIKGVGPYARNSLAMIIGQYDGVPVDSEYKKHVIQTYFQGVAPSKKELETVYDKWGEYKYLAYWFDYNQK
ncbi:hypothetical protein ABC345_01965 [Shouchella sp. 1P09AA]|uniref:hypothetical protein n=1 Tax=unclassified Shouchella TaxID=2893065 RepID=UPI00399FE0A2